MDKITIGVRDVDEDTFRKFKAWAVNKKLNLGKALSEAIKNYIENTENLNKKKEEDALKELKNLKPIKVGKKKVRWSEEIDEILYGGK